MAACFCGRAHFARGLCSLHYERQRIYGSTEPRRHRVTNVDEHSGVGSCEICGRVKVRMRGNGRVACDTKRREMRIQKLYGISLEYYETMLSAQGGKCAICKATPGSDTNRGGRSLPLCVDHDHSSGAVRGLLCRRCNLTVGMLQDDIKLGNAVIDYLTHYSPDEA